MNFMNFFPHPIASQRGASGYCDPYVVYGWNESEEHNYGEMVIDETWLKSNDIDLFSYGMMKIHATSAVYGIACGINSTTGAPSISIEDKAKVEKAYAKATKHLEEIGEEVGKLGYHKAMKGNFLWNQDKYTPGVEGTVEVHKMENHSNELLQHIMMRSL